MLTTIYNKNANMDLAEHFRKNVATVPTFRYLPLTWQELILLSADASIEYAFAESERENYQEYINNEFANIAYMVRVSWDN